MAGRQRMRRSARSAAPSLNRLVNLLGHTGGAARQSLVALVFNSTTSFIAGLTLVSLTSTMQRLPGLLVLITPAIGLRGNVYSTLGNRLSTAIHTGTYALSFRRESVLMQNLVASISLTMSMSALLAVVAKVTAVAIGIEHTIGLLDLMTISVVGGVLGSIPVALATVILAMGAVRYGWDLDNLVAPMVGTLGDALTVPALWLAALLVLHVSVSPLLGLLLGSASLVAVVMSLRSRFELLRSIVRESIPVLTVALLLSTLGGLILQKQLGVLVALPAIFVLQPAFVSTAGALGGILSGRVATNLHLGSIEPTLVPSVEARRDIAFLLGLTVPIFVINSAGAVIFAALRGSDAPGWWWVLTVSILAAAISMILVIAISYSATIGAWRIEVDPDSYGVPIVTASADFIGTMILVFVVAAFALGP